MVHTGCRDAIFDARTKSLRCYFTMPPYQPRCRRYYHAVMLPLPHADISMDAFHDANATAVDGIAITDDRERRCDIYIIAMKSARRAICAAFLSRRLAICYGTTPIRRERLPQHDMLFPYHTVTTRHR